MNPGTARQGGAIAIMFALMLLTLIGLCGLAIDLGLVYNRKAELQGVANSAAIAAAKELNGSGAGVGNALAKASGAAGQLRYQYNGLPVVWSNAAIAFSTSPGGNWLDAGAALAAPDGLQFVKVDTNKLDAAHSTVELIFMRVLSDRLASTTTGAQAIAGRLSINATALALCAMSNSPAAARANPGPPANTELIEFGFRRGVSYDLMNLNPAAGTTTPENFLVDPIDPPGQPGMAANLAPEAVGPFICSGRLAMARLTGGPITVGRPFPLGALYQQLNSRFDQFNGDLCHPNGAPPDSNIKFYTYHTSIPWMAPAPGAQSAQSTSAGGKLWTVADPLPAPSGNTAPMYGPLWAYARAVPYSVYTPGVLEPAGGYAPFPSSAWATLYKPGVPVAGSSYPGGGATPYRSTSGSNFAAPSSANRPGVANRRVLNIPLLSCPVGAGGMATATVLGVGKFFMTVPATATKLYAEFAGAVPDLALGGPVELYQ